MRNEDRHRENVLNHEVPTARFSASGSCLRATSEPHGRPPAPGARRLRSARALARPLHGLETSGTALVLGTRSMKTMSTTPKNRPLAVVGNQRTLPRFLLFCNGVIAGVGSTANATLFAGLATLLATLASDMKILTTAQGNAAGGTKSPGTIGDRNTARAAVEKDVANLRVAVQQLADASPATAADIIVKAGFQVKKRPVRNKPAFTVGHGVNSGEAQVAIKSPGRGRTVEFQASPDGGKTWPFDTFGPELSHLFTGLTVGVLWSFRYRVKIAKQPMGDWSDPITLTIK